jgi:hypothetical protein
MPVTRSRHAIMAIFNTKRFTFHIRSRLATAKLPQHADKPPAGGPGTCHKGLCGPGDGGTSNPLLPAYETASNLARRSLTRRSH